MKLGYMLGVGLVGLTVAAGVTIGRKSDTPRAQTAPAPPAVTVATPLARSITEYDEFTGRFEPTAMVEIRPRVSGYLTAINFTDGQTVEAGQTLFVIDKQPYQVALAQAEAQRANAIAQQKFAENELKRAEQLLASSNLSTSIYEQRVQQRDVADAAVQAAEAAVRRAALDLDYTEVRSPIRGRASNRRVDVGNLVVGDGNSTILTTVMTEDDLYFVFDVSEGDFAARQEAADTPATSNWAAGRLPVDARLDNQENWTRQGVLNFLDNRFQPGAGTIRARALFANSDRAVTPGQFGRIRLPRSSAHVALLVPESAILNDQTNKIVLVVGADNVVRQRAIVPGPAQAGGLRIVRTGLAADDRVIINGLMQARPNAAVSPQPGSIGENRVSRG
jgi:RND family efflux transporter MFP subunit